MEVCAASDEAKQSTIGMDIDGALFIVLIRSLFIASCWYLKMVLCLIR